MRFPQAVKIQRKNSLFDCLKGTPSQSLGLTHIMQLALLFRCCFTGLGVILFSALIKKGKQICPKAVEGVRCVRGWWETCKDGNSRNLHPAPQQRVGREGISWFPYFFQHWVKHLSHFVLGVDPCLLPAQMISHNFSLKIPSRDRTWFGNGLWMARPGLRHRIPAWLWKHSPCNSAGLIFIFIFWSFSSG